MANITRFEDLEAWQRARELTREVYRATRTGRFSRDFGLKDQIRRAAVSVMSNVAEGFERGGNPEFLQFLSIAKGSVGEVRSQLYVATDEEYLTPDQFSRLNDLAHRTGQIIGGLSAYLRKSDIRGPKYDTRKLPTRNAKRETRNDEAAE